jgi:hypothetical protein
MEVIVKSILVVMLSSSVCFGGLIEGTNINGYPFLLPETASELGWVYTIQSPGSYYLESIQTKFSDRLGWIIDPLNPYYYDVEAEGWNRTVVLEIYTAAPCAGGRLLRTAAFTPEPDTLVGGAFEPFLMNPNDTLFIALRNIQGLGMNNTIGPDWLVTYGGTAIPSTGSYETLYPYPSSPVLLLYGTLVPEPATILLLTLGGLLTRRPTS